MDPATTVLKSRDGFFPRPPEGRIYRVWLCDLGDPRGEKSVFGLQSANLINRLLAGKGREIRMAPAIVIEIPREIAHAARMTPQELKRELATHLYRLGRLSFGKARELAGMTVWDYQQWLGMQGVSVHYDVEEYDTDITTLTDLPRR